MHELSLCQNLLDIIEQQAKQRAFTQVHVVRLELGNFVAVEVDALRFAFEVASRDTRAAHARLDIIPVPAKIRCEYCQRYVTIRRRFDSCPACGRYGLQISGGDEIRITALEVD